MNNLTVKEIVNMLDNGKQPVISFANICNFSNEILDDNMMGKILKYKIDYDCNKCGRHYILTIDIGKFEIYNASFVKNTFYDRNENPAVNAKQVEYYEPITELSCGEYDEIGYLEESNNIWDRYEKDNHGFDNYIEFLEYVAKLYFDLSK